MNSSYIQDYYYYADNYNYTEYYVDKYGLTQRTALFTGIGYILFAGITLALYLRLLTVIICMNKMVYTVFH